MSSSGHGLVSRFLAAWGFAGYRVFLAGAVLEILGYPLGVLLAIPGGLFEVFLGIWLLVKGLPAAGTVKHASERRSAASADRGAMPVVS